jgi:hypothetical protein
MGDQDEDRPKTVKKTAQPSRRRGWEKKAQELNSNGHFTHENQGSRRTHRDLDVAQLGRVDSVWTMTSITTPCSEKGQRMGIGGADAATPLLDVHKKCPRAGRQLKRTPRGNG